MNKDQEWNRIRHTQNGRTFVVIAPHRELPVCTAVEFLGTEVCILPTSLDMPQVAAPTTPLEALRLLELPGPGRLPEAELHYWRSRLLHTSGVGSVAPPTGDDCLTIEASLAANATHDSEPDVVATALSEATERIGLLRTMSGVKRLPAATATSSHGVSVVGQALQTIKEVCAALESPLTSPLLGIDVKICTDPSLPIPAVRCSRFNWQLEITCHPIIFKIPTFVRRLGWILHRHASWLAGESSRIRDSSIRWAWLGDGLAEPEEVPGADPILAFCTTHPHNPRLHLVADPYAQAAVAWLRDQPNPLPPAAARVEFLNRREVVYWRGSTTGATDPNAPDLTAQLLSNRRIRFCFQARQLGPLFDVAISDLVQIPSGAEAGWHDHLSRWNILTARVPEVEFRRNRFYIDLDGNSSAWGTLVKYLGMCLVIKPVSAWHLDYHSFLQPGHNYIRIDDMDAEQTAEAVMAMGPSEAFEIAYRGHLMAHRFLRSLIEPVRDFQGMAST